MKLLKTLLWLCGLLFFSAFPLMVVSWGVVEGFCRWLGLPVLPADTLTVYFYRISCAFCGVTSIYFFIMASDPLRYLKFVLLAGWGMIFIGLVALVSGIMVEMRPPWYIADGGFAVLIGLLIIVLARQILPPAQPTADSPTGKSE